MVADAERRAQVIAHAVRLVQRRSRMRVMLDANDPALRSDQYAKVCRVLATVEDDLAASWSLHVTPQGRIVRIAEYDHAEIA